jgi:hypothetical protein
VIRFAIDWDDTCVENAYPANNGAWKPGAVAGLRELSKHGEVVIWTCRIAGWTPDEGSRLPAAQVAFEIESIRARLREQGLDGVEVWTKEYKPPAVAYVDDKAVHYNGRKGAWKALVPKLLLLAGKDPSHLYEEEEAAD